MPSCRLVFLSRKKKENFLNQLGYVAMQSYQKVALYQAYKGEPERILFGKYSANIRTTIVVTSQPLNFECPRVSNLNISGPRTFYEF